MSISKVGFRRSCSIRLIIEWDIRARFATAFIESPSAIRFCCNRRMAVEQTRSGFDFVTPYQYLKRSLTNHVTIGTTGAQAGPFRLRNGKNQFKNYGISLHNIHPARIFRRPEAMGRLRPQLDPLWHGVPLRPLDRICMGRTGILDAVRRPRRIHIPERTCRFPRRDAGHENGREDAGPKPQELTWP